jgi:hypothetical protein
MTYKAQINPQLGQSFNNVTLLLTSDKKVDANVKVENGTHLSTVDEFKINANEVSIERHIDLNIPEHSSDSMISIFISIEEKNDDREFELVQVIPIVYCIDEKVLSETDSLFNISPSFAGQDDTCKVSVKGKTEDRYIISINDKRFNVIIGPSGIGTIHFKSKDVLGLDFENIVHKFPMYYYSSSDNYTIKYFSGNYIHIIPNDIKAAVDEDPRCLDYDPLTWTAADQCFTNISNSPATPLSIEIPNHEIPSTSCDYDDCDSTCACESVTSALDDDACRIHKFSTTLLSNGMALNSYISVDDSIGLGEDEFNIQRIFIKSDTTSVEAQLIGAQNVAVLPKEADENFTIFIGESIYNRIVELEANGKSVFVVFMDEDIQYQGFPLIEVQDTDEYLAYFPAIVDRDISNVSISELKPCVYAVFYEFDGATVVPSVIIPSDIQKLPFINVLGEPVTATNISISSNSDYRGTDGESIVHVVAEAYVSGKIQLFYYGFSVGPSVYTSTNSDSWTMLTSTENNKNAKTVTDKYNNLHIFWESDRTGLSQIYYGVLGPSSVFYSNSVLSSIIDKKAELNRKEDKPFGYLHQDIIESTGETLSRVVDDAIFESNGDIIYPNKGILSTAWVKNETNDGEVSVTDFNDVANISITASSLSDTAVAFTSLNRDNFLDLSSGLLSQINYQVSFDFDGDLGQDASSSLVLLDQDDIDDLYSSFKSQFTETTDSDIVNNLPFYVSGSNRFTIGKEESIYDRFIPMMGAYKNTDLENYVEGQTTSTDFEIIASGSDRTLNHFFIAVIPEKIRFKATNIEDSDTFQNRVGESVTYVLEEIQEYYTGRASLAVIYTNDNYLFDYELSNTIVRNISKPFILSETTQMEILVNYSKMFGEDSTKYLNVPAALSSDYPRFVCSLSVIVDQNPEFSESFIVDLSDQYRSFDIGLGVTSKGSFKADVFYPYNSSVFENTVVQFNYSNVVISSPTYQVNSSIGSIPSYAREQSDFSTYDFYGNTEDIIENFFDNYDFLFDDIILDPSTGEVISGYSAEAVDPSTGDGFDISTQSKFALNEFMQLPLTLEGVNSNLSISLDFINDIHLSWQSNRDRNWNIFYSNSTDKKIPFRYDTRITDTNSNSLSPDVATAQDGKRMIVWHDNRNEIFQVLSARALESSVSADEVCERTGRLLYTDETEADTVTSVINFSQSNDDISTGDQNLHFRVTFYADAAKERVVYSSFSLIDNKRWYVKGSTYGSLPESGLVLPDDTSVEIFYVPDIYPQQLFNQQTAISLTGSVEEVSLLSGVKYYVDIESYDIDTIETTLISTVEFRFNASDVETNFWREDLDKKRWICSGQGQDDLVVVDRGEQSLFPSIASNMFEYFYIVCQSSKDGVDTIVNSFWDTSLDMLYSSGQGLWETEGPFSGQQPHVIMDQGQSFYIVSSDDDNIYSSKCRLPFTSGEIVSDPSAGTAVENLCKPGTLTSLDSSFGDFVVRVSSEDTVGSFVTNKDDIVSVIDKTAINIDIAGVYGAYAVRIRNQNGSWSSWIDINNQEFIENGRFVVPWSIPRINGLRHLCCQVLTIYGVTPINCIDIFVNMQIVDYVVEYFEDIARTNEVTVLDGFSLLATKGEDSAEIYIRVIFSEPQAYTSLKFDVIHQGISTIFDKELLPEGSLPTLNYLGSFTIRKEDGIYDKDGTGFLKVKFRDESSSTDECVSDKRDLYNQMLITSELEFLDTVSLDPADAFQEYLTGTVSKVLDINEFKQYYDQDDPDSLFGDAGFYRN